MGKKVASKSMKIKTSEGIVKLSELTPNPDNARTHPDVQIAELIKSLDKFGQTRSIVVDEKNTILIGHAIFEAMKRRGDAKAKVLKLTGLSNSQKIKLMLSDNRLHEMGKDDNAKIKEVLQWIGKDLSIPGFDAGALNMLVADLNGDDIVNSLKVSGSMSGEETVVLSHPMDRRVDTFLCPHCKKTFAYSDLR